MTPTGEDFVQLTARIQMDLQAAQSKMVELRAWIAGLDLPSDAPTCPDCGVSVAGAQSLAEHQYHSHDGPEPAHWREAERRSAA